MLFAIFACICTFKCKYTVFIHNESIIMAISKEVRTGVMVAISLFVIITGIYFLKGSNVFSADKNYYAYFKNVEGLVPSASVQINGIVVGSVNDVALAGRDSVKVTLAINKKHQIPEGTIASLFAPDLMSGKAIKLELGNSSRILEDNERVQTKVQLGGLDKITSSLDPIVADATKVMGRLDSIMATIQAILNPATQKNLESGLASLDVTMKNFASLSTSLNKESAQLAGVIRNANSISGNISKNNNEIDAIIGNLKITSEQLSKASIDETIKSLQATLDQTHILLSKINKGEGSLGLMANDKQLYNNVTTSMSSLDKLLDDLKKHPSRYINIRLFGKAPKDN